MAKHAGRKVILEDESGEPIANLRTKELSVDREPIDVTDDDSSGWREILPEPGQVNINISISGVLANDTIRQAAISTNGLSARTLVYPDGGEITADFFLASYSETHEYNEASTFEGELQSSGTATYTPPEQ